MAYKRHAKVELISQSYGRASKKTLTSRNKLIHPQLILVQTKVNNTINTTRAKTSNIRS